MGFLDNYQPVEDRLREYWERHPYGRVITELVSDPSLSNAGDVILFKCSLYFGSELRDQPPIATGYAHQRILGDPPTKRDGSPNRDAPEWTSPYEVAETSAIGRALANCGLAPKGKRPSREEVSKASAATGARASVPSTPPARAHTEVRAEQGTVTRPRVVEGEMSGGGGYGADGFGEGPEVFPTGGSSPSPDSALAALLEAVGGSEVKAINAVNKAVGGGYRKSDLEGLSPDEWAAGLALVVMR